MADVNFAVVRGSLTDGPVSAYTDFTKADFGTPTACIVLVNNAGSGSNPNIRNLGSIGFYDGTNQLSHGWASDDGVSTSQTRRGCASDVAVFLINGVATKYAEYEASFIEDGVRLTMTIDGTTLARYATVILMNGTDLSVDVGSLALNDTENFTASVSSLSYEPDVVISASSGLDSTDVNGAFDSSMSFGVAVNDGTQTQRSFLWNAEQGVSTSQTMERVETDSVCGQFINDSVDYTGQLTSFNADGFTITTRGGASGADYIFWMALHLGGGDAWLGTLTTLTSATTDSITGPGFTPNFLLATGSDASAVDTDTTSACMSYSIGATDGTQDSSCAWRDEDNLSSDTDCDSETNERLIDIRNYQNGNDLTYATLSSFDANGFTLSYGAAGATAYKGWILAIGDGAAATFGGVSQVIGGNVIVA